MALMMTSENLDKSAEQRPLPGEVEHAYASIGRLLLVAEAAAPGIGIPWVPPTPRTRALKNEFFEPLKDFVRSGLVGVSTATIEMYIEDLENLPTTDEAANRLKIGGLSAFERLSLTVLLFATCFSIVFVSAVWVNTGIRLAISLGALVGTIVAAVSAYICCESSRRSTFHWILFEEILRRRGIDEPGNTAVPLYINPATEG